MVIVYPFGLRTILKQGKSRNQPAQFSMTDPARGPGYVSPTGSDVPTLWNVVFKFTEHEARRFWLWFTDPAYLDKGRNTFILPIKTEFGMVDHEVQFLPDSLLPATEDGALWQYTGVIRARSLIVPDVYTDMSSYIIEDYMMTDEERALFDEAMNQEWPAA